MPLPYNVVYFSPDPASRPATGTASDPFFATTSAQLDNQINGSGGSPGLPAGTVIFLMPGSYQTGGLILKAGQSLIGSGISATTLTLNSGANGTPYQIEVIRGVGDGVSVENMTVDAASLSLKSTWRKIYNLVLLQGNYCAIKNIHGRNPYGDNTLRWPASSSCQTNPAGNDSSDPTHRPCVDTVAPSEGFAICIAGDYNASPGAPPIVRAIIEDCRLDDVQGDYVIGISILDGAVDASIPTYGQIRGCVVNGSRWVAYTCFHGQVIGNTSYQCGHFWRNDTHIVRNLLLQDNRAIECNFGYAIQHAPSFRVPADGNFGENLVIQGNLITYTNSPEPDRRAQQAIYLDGYTSGTFDGVSIANNTVHYPSGNLPTVGFVSINSGFYKNVSVSNNISNGGNAIAIGPGANVGTMALTNNLLNGKNVGYDRVYGPDLNELVVKNDYGGSGGSAGLGAYFVTKRGGIDWLVKPSGNTDWTIRNLVGSSLVNAISGSETGMVSIPGRLSIGGGDAVVNVRTGTATLSIPALTAGSVQPFDITVTGAIVAGSPSVHLGWSAAFNGNLAVTLALVYAANTVRIRIANFGTTTTSSQSLTCRATVISF